MWGIVPLIQSDSKETCASKVVQLSWERAYIKTPPPLWSFVHVLFLHLHTCLSRRSRSKPSIVTYESGMLFLRKVSVTMKISIFSLFISMASRLQAFWLVELTFFNEQTFRTAIVGRRELLMFDV